MYSELLPLSHTWCGAVVAVTEKGSFGAPGSSPPGGGNPGNPPDGRGPLLPLPPPGGGGRAGGGGGGPGGGGNGKLTGNPPTEFNGDCTKAEAFMSKFDLYVLVDTNIMASPMKKATIFLSYIKGELVKDWMKRWVDWMINQYEQGRPAYDPYYWDQVSGAFQNAFQDTRARERVEYKLKNFQWNPESVDTFLATFELLAFQARYGINAQPMLTALALKLPFSMMNHIVKIV